MNYIADMIVNLDPIGVAVMFVILLTCVFSLAINLIISKRYISLKNTSEDTKETLMISIKEYLDNSAAQVVERDKEADYNLMNKTLKETFVKFGESIENTLKQTVESYGEKLTSVVMDVNVTSKTLDNTVEKFDLALKNFASNISDFTEFNNNLKSNIEKMDTNFINVTEVLSNTSKTISKNYNSIEGFSKNIKDVANEMTEYNQQIIQDMANIAVEVKNTVSTVKGLSETIQKDLDVRTDEIKKYHDKINDLMSKLDSEVNLLGQKTSEIFIKNLDENAQMVSQKIVENMDDILKDVFVIMDEFKANEKMLAKTITMLPEQFLTYNENTSDQIKKQVDEVKRLLRNS